MTGARRATAYWAAGGQYDGGQTAWKRALATRCLAGGEAVLDIGCGDGASSVAGWIGLEGDRGAAAKAADQGVRAVVADVEVGLPVRSAAFSGVVLFDVLEHVPDPSGLLREAARALAPGGTLLVALPNAAHLANRLGAVRGRVSDFTDAAHHDGAPVSDHLHRFSPMSTERLLNEAGFTVRRRWPWAPDRFSEGGWRFVSPLAWLLARTGARFRPSLFAYELVFEAVRDGDPLPSPPEPGASLRESVKRSARAASAGVAGGWADDDPRYRGYRPRGGLDHRVATALDLVPHGEVVVDVGAGDGYVAALAGTRAGAAVTVAVDYGFPRPLADPVAPLSRMRADIAQALPVADGAVDIVISLEVIEHLPDPDLLLEEARRVLRPGGSLVLSTPRLDSLLVVVNLLAGLQPPGLDSSVRERYGNPLGEGRPSGHLHLFTRRSLREALTAHGFTIELERQGRFSSSWKQARAGRRRRLADAAGDVFFVIYDLVPFRKDVLIVRARKPADG